MTHPTNHRQPRSILNVLIHQPTRGPNFHWIESGSPRLRLPRRIDERSRFQCPHWLRSPMPSYQKAEGPFLNPLNCHGLLETLVDGPLNGHCHNLITRLITGYSINSQRCSNRNTPSSPIPKLIVRGSVISNVAPGFFRWIKSSIPGPYTTAFSV